MTDGPCRDCEAACCGHYAIYVTHRDVARLARATGHEPVTFCHAEREVISPHLPRPTIDGAPAQLVLQAAPDSDRCLFQDPVSRRCLVHDHSPRICQIYPFQARDGRIAEFEQREDVICPAPFPLDDGLRRHLARSARRFWRRELPAYERKVAAWNRRPRGDGSLPAFLKTVLRRFPPLL